MQFGRDALFRARTTTRVAVGNQGWRPPHPGAGGFGSVPRQTNECKSYVRANHSPLLLPQGMPAGFLHFAPLGPPLSSTLVELQRTTRPRPAHVYSKTALVLRFCVGEQQIVA